VILNPNGWFPHFSPSGKIASGELNGGGIFAEGQLIAKVGWRPRWIDDNRVVFNAGDTQHGIWDARTGAIAYHDPAFSVTPAGGGKYVGWAAAEPFAAKLNGIVTLGEQTGEPWVSRRGDIVFPTDYHGVNHAIVCNGQPIVPPTPHLVDPRTEDGLVVWSEYRSVHGRMTCGYWDGVIRHLGIFDPVADADTHNEFAPIPVMTPIGPWLVHGTHWGFVVRQWGSSQGYVRVGEMYNADAMYLNGVIYVVGSNAHGGALLQIIDLRDRMTDILTAARGIVGANTPPPPPPPAQPTPTPKEPTVPVPDLQSTAAAFLGPRLTRLSTHDATREHSFNAVNDLAIYLRATDARWGLLEKLGGDRVRDRAADVLLYKISSTEAQVVDVVSDAEGADGAPRPGWSVKDIRPIAQWKEPYAASVPGPVTPVPGPTTPPPDEISMDQALDILVDTFAREIRDIFQQGIAEALAPLTQRIKELEARPTAQPTRIPRHIALRSDDGKYASARYDEHDHVKVVDREKPEGWETWELIPLD
jgi:hypothetical protein